MRTGFGSNNVDHCTRLCHASSVAALLEGIGSGAVSNPVMDVTRAEVVIVIGANPTVNHPVAATWMKNAARTGVKLIVADPRRSDLARHAHRFLQFKPDTDVALLNAMMHTIVEEGLVDPAFIAERTSGYDALAANVAHYSPEAMAPICGIDAETIRYVARLYATSKGSMILWGMGISQHVHGTDNARCLIALALMTGQIGRPGTGLHPLRGQNNVQGASDAGLIPMMYPDYRRVDDAFLDPLVFNPASVLGVPALMSAFATGNLTIANAVGTGIADDKAVYSYMPEIVRFYSGEDAILNNVPTWRCREPDALAYVLDHLGELVVKEVDGSGGYGMLVGPHATKAQIEEFAAKLRHDPAKFIAQPTLALSTCPTLVDEGVAPRHVDLRPFVLSGADGVRIVPGGLTRVAMKEGSLVVNSSQGGGTKDTWVLDV